MMSKPGLRSAITLSIFGGLPSFGTAAGATGERGQAAQANGANGQRAQTTQTSTTSASKQRDRAAANTSSLSQSGAQRSSTATSSQVQSLDRDAKARQQGPSELKSINGKVAAAVKAVRERGPEETKRDQFIETVFFPPGVESVSAVKGDFMKSNNFVIRIGLLLAMLMGL
jgi:hypothetical protein